MISKKIAIAADHGGYILKAEIIKNLESKGFEVLNLGTDGPASVDYPDFGHALANAIENNDVDRGILVCGSGIGISIAANRHKGIRAALCTNGLMARLARQHNNANIIALGARTTGILVALDCIEEFLNTKFEGGRHQIRIDKI
ncbi:MAG: ribose 5-phosphate isomerase B [Sphingomonadales bacterium]|jgi:ribose 5-phosphate isomerase B